jgi:serine/threonine-protein kinase
MTDDTSDTLERLRASLADRYVVERELGRGGMATVYLARDVRHDRDVAIKVLHPDLAATIGSERFEREIKLAARLQHPHILGLYDSGATDRLLFYVMPFVRGESLRDRITRDGQLPVDDAVQIALEVADALGYAHEQGIVHRDIKPENILLSNGHALVADFGIARAVSEVGTQKLTQTGMALGTPVYMSPEQATGETVGPGADIYSLGCVLYEMLAGEPPFTGKNSMAIMARHAMDTVPSVRIVRPAVPEEVEEAIFASMEKSVADRPKTAADFTAIMGVPLGATATRRVTGRHTATRRIPSGAHSMLELAPAWWRRPRTWVAVVLVAAVGALASWKLGGGPKVRAGGAVADTLARRVAVLYFTTESKDAALRPVADGITEALIRSLGEVKTLQVVSRNGVALFRGVDVSKDSVARALHAGTLVVGSVEPEGEDRVRVSTRLLDGSGADIGKRTSVVLARDSLFRAEESVAREVSRTLREWLGEEVRLKESQAGTQSLAAWTVFNRAETDRKDAEQSAATDPARAATLLIRADSLLQQAEAADPKWLEPITLQGDVTVQRARLATDRTEKGRLYQQAAEIAEKALTADAGDAHALALRGTARYALWAVAGASDPVARQAQLDGALKDLESAVQKDGTLASAYAMLSSLYYQKQDKFTALSRARQAYEADAYLSNTDLILDRLFWTSYDTEQFSEARKWCDEGGRRFPADSRFAACQLWFLLTPDATPDVPAAWQLAARVATLSAVDERQYQTHLAQLVVGGVIGRQARVAPAAVTRRALLDSAGKVLVRARGDRTVDPEHELVGYEAVMRTQMGEYDVAVSLLKQYVAVNPDHSFRVGANTHWWWRDLRSVPGFEALLSRER